MKSNYHYEYECRTDNLCYGCILIGTYPTRNLAVSAGVNARKGCFSVRRVRVPN